jgi:hypothetical protein
MRLGQPGREQGLLAPCFICAIRLQDHEGSQIKADLADAEQRHPIINSISTTCCKISRYKADGFVAGMHQRIVRLPEDNTRSLSVPEAGEKDPRVKKIQPTSQNKVQRTHLQWRSGSL